MKIVFASNNAGKIKELQSLLTPFNLTVTPQHELAVPEIAETGLSFVENAIIKARNACQVTGLPALADDSGLEVDTLQGAPGIFSARYAGKHATAQDNIKKLLAELDKNPERSARFHCILVFMLHVNDSTPLICHGTWEGRILYASQGEQGFGYDPVFFDETYQKSAAELSLNIKNKISHRGNALRLLLTQLPNKLAQLQK